MMPEGPELAYSRDQLQRVLRGNKIVDVRFGSNGRYSKNAPQGFTEFAAEMAKSRPRIAEIATKGKFMSWRLEFDAGEPWYLHCTYGMSGAWQTTMSKHAAASVSHNASGQGITRDVKHIHFNDPRHFGTLKFVRGEEEHQRKLNTLGPCILSDQVNPEIFAKRLLRKPNRNIGEALMDQSGVSGIGNYLRAEILFDCNVDPWRGVTEVTPAEYASLCESTLRIAAASYKSQGATIKTYRTVDGASGSTQFSFQVYSKKSCPAGHPIQCQQDANGRTVHWCPNCQK